MVLFLDIIFFRFPPGSRYVDPLKNGWLEDYVGFFFGRACFLGAMSVSFREGRVKKKQRHPVMCFFCDFFFDELQGAKSQVNKL